VNHKLPAIAATCVALLLSACLFGKDDDSLSYTTELYETTRVVYAYDADGSVKQRLGVGIEVTASGTGAYAVAGGDGPIRVDLQDGENGLLFLWPAGIWDEILDTGDFVAPDTLTDLIPGGSSSVSPSFLGLTRDSTFILGVEDGILLPGFRIRDARKGFPCTFSRAKAFQIATNGDTIPLKVSGTHLDRADSVRFAVILDEDALTAHAGFDSREPVTATVRVDCPDF
jgi:hypothetical protein